jgi:formylglycine-generating enzyme required for sulfatase activity
MSPIVTRLALLLLIFFSGNSAAAYNGRIALVVGVADYDKSSLDLDNPVNDAKEIHATLSSLGFSSRLLMNPDFSELDQAVTTFGKESHNAAIALFYFAGHGFQVNGANALLPSDAQLLGEITQEGVEGFGLERTITLSDVFSKFEHSDAVKMVFLDACRNDPRKQQGASFYQALPQGFADVEFEGVNNYVVYSTSPGKFAADGEGENSPFAASLNHHLNTPGIVIEQVMKRVTRDLQIEEQVPWVVGSLSLDVVLNRKKGEVAAPYKSTVLNQPSLPLVEMIDVESDGLKTVKNSWVHTAPDVESMELMVVPKGIRLKSSKASSDGQWVFVMLSNGVQGYLQRQNLMVSNSRELDEGKEGVYSERIKDCDGCPSMQLIQEGKFIMGRKGGNQSESPPHEVQILEPFYLARHEASFYEWDLCYREGGCSLSPKDFGYGRKDNPVVGVNWRDVGSYLDWLSIKTGVRYRLPTEAEWEYAAGMNRSDKIPAAINCRGCGRSSKKHPLPRIYSEEYPLGLSHMLGNVREWVEDCVHLNYRAAPIDGAAWLSGECNRRVTRGGSWYTQAAATRVTSRRFEAISRRTQDLGFRVARDIQ